MDRWIDSSWKLPALSGAILGSAYHLPLLVPAFVAFVPLLYWIDRHPHPARYVRLKGGFVFGLVTHLITLHFLYSLLVFTWLAAALYLGWTVGLGLRIALAVALLGYLRRRTGITFGVLLPVCWIPFEWLQSFGDLRMTGDQLANTLAGYPFLVQFADLVGPYGVAAFLLAVNGLLYEALLAPGRAPGRRAALALAVLVVAVLVYDTWCWVRPPDPVATTRVAVVQPNIPLRVKMTRGTEPQQWEVLDRLSREASAAEPDLIVWPETARPGPVYHWLDRPETYGMPDVQGLARELGVPMLVGGEYLRVRDRSDFDLYNAAIAVDGAGGILPEWAAKVYLVPFSEGLPFERWLGPLIEGRGGEWQWMSGGFSPGPRSTVVGVAGARVGVLVCFEQLFADLGRDLHNAGAEFQVVITNDAWFLRSVFQRYQANALRLRAIENRTAFVRAANTGISGFVDDRGRYHNATALFEEAVEVWDVPRSSRRTVYSRTGDVVVWLGLVALASILLLGRRTIKR